MSVKLRDYQRSFVAAILAAWETVLRVLGVLPTGAGKTVCFSSIINEHKGSSAAIVHRKEILGQISSALAQLEVPHRVVAPDKVVTRIRRKHLKRFGRSFVDPHAEAGVVSVQTLTSGSSSKNRELQKWIKQVSLAVFDEGHHYVKQGFWARAVDLFPLAKMLFVTATPERADGKGLGAQADGFADVMVEGPSTRWMIEQGYLCKFTYKAPSTDLDLADIPLTAGGEVNTKAMRKRIVESHLVGDVVSQYKQFSSGKKAIVFANDVATAEDMATAFNAAGIPAAALSGETDEGVRDRTLDEFEEGKLLVLVNVDLFDEGFDVPAVDTVIIARITESLSKYLQMVGRALRVLYGKGFDLQTAQGRLDAIAASDKPFATVIDPVRNWERHGMPDWPRVWDLLGREKGSRGEAGGLTPQRICVGVPEWPGCTQPFEKFHSVCPYCGAPVAPPSGRSSPEQVEGDLVELDVEAMAALFAAMAHADMPDDEYRADQIRRGIPSIGRPKDLRRHRETKHRREVLRNLVGWWVGMQAGRELSEIHRRFYHRFGIDIASAFTLKLKETDTLIDLIQKRFREDIPL